MAEFGMAKDPSPKTNSMAEEPIKMMPNTLYEHFGFLLRSGVAPEEITLRVLSRPKWFKRSLELRRDGASKQEIFWTLSSTNDPSDLFSCEERTLGTFRVPDRQVRKRNRTRLGPAPFRIAQDCKDRFQDVDHRLRRQVVL